MIPGGFFQLRIVRGPTIFFPLPSLQCFGDLVSRVEWER